VLVAEQATQQGGGNQPSGHMIMITLASHLEAGKIPTAVAAIRVHCTVGFIPT